MLSKTIIAIAVAALAATTQAKSVLPNRPSSPSTQTDKPVETPADDEGTVVMWCGSARGVDFYRPTTYDDWTTQGTGFDGANPDIELNPWYTGENTDRVDEPMCKLGKNLYVKCAIIEWDAPMQGVPQGDLYNLDADGSRNDEDDV